MNNSDYIREQLREAGAKMWNGEIYVDIKNDSILAIVLQWRLNLQWDDYMGMYAIIDRL